jgi:hypothetical protein
MNTTTSEDFPAAPSQDCLIVTAPLQTEIMSLTVRTLAALVAIAAGTGWLAARADEPAAEGEAVQTAAEESMLPGGLLLEPAGDVALPSMPATPTVARPATEALPSPPPIVEDVMISVPEVLDVSGPDGMLLDDGALDEMPFEASSGRWFWNGGWYVGGESLWMDRSRNNRTIVAADVATRDVTYTTFAQPFDVAPGARATIGKSLGRDYLDRDRFFEFVYYGGMAYEDADGWNSVGANSLFTPLDFRAPGFNAAGAYATNISSDFNSWEWNYKLRRRLGRDQLVMSPGGNWTRHAERGWLPALIVGVRTANVNEDFSLTSTRPGVSTDQFGGRYLINTSNWLLGLNLGGELISQNEFYYWGLRGRAAPALSFANASQSAVGVNTTTTAPQGVTNFASEAGRTGAGFLGDLTLFAGWQITPNFSLQAGYDFLWVAGMATATRQFNLDQRDSNAIDVGGQTFYNGVSFGFYGSW